MNDETLTLYYYNDGLTAGERRQVAHLLATDDDAAKRYQAICRQLDRLASPDMAAPPTDMVERWHESLKRAARSEAVVPENPALHTRSFIWGAAITAALAIGIGIGVFISGETSNQSALPAEFITRDTNSSAFVRGLQVHLRESEQGLSTLPLDAGTDRTILIMDIIDQNRLFAKAAQRNDSQNLARVLRAFELVLVRLAAEDISSEDAEELRAKLLFELNVMLTKLSRDASEEPQTI